MKLEYNVISAVISAVVSYRYGNVLVRLSDGRTAVVDSQTLTKFGINPTLGDPRKPQHEHIAAMRDALEGSHATLRREASRLSVTGLHDYPVQVLKVDPDMVNEICSRIAFGGALSGEMRAVVSFLKGARHSTLRKFYEQIQSAVRTPQSEIRPLHSVGESLVQHYI